MSGILNCEDRELGYKRKKTARGRPTGIVYITRYWFHHNDSQ